MAGSKTTIDSLTAIFALVFHHPDWMKTLRSDLDTAVGHSIPTLDHIPVLPRIEAFLSEVPLIY